jgi:hypothetical protein
MNSDLEIQPASRANIPLRQAKPSRMEPTGAFIDPAREAWHAAKGRFVTNLDTNYFPLLASWHEAGRSRSAISYTIYRRVQHNRRPDAFVER